MTCRTRRAPRRRSPGPAPLTLPLALALGAACHPDSPSRDAAPPRPDEPASAPRAPWGGGPPAPAGAASLDPFTRLPRGQALPPPGPRGQRATLDRAPWIPPAPSSPDPSPRAPAQLTALAQLSVGDGFACVLWPPGPAHCWDTGGPTPAPPLDLEQLTVAGERACGLDRAGGLHCWDAAGQPGWTPPGRYAQIALSRDAACAISAEPPADLRCWGAPAWDLPAAAAQGPYDRLALDETRLCARRLDGALDCFGPVPEGWPGLRPVGDFAIHGVLCALPRGGGLPACSHPAPFAAFDAILTAPDRLCGLRAGEALCVGADPDTDPPPGRWRQLALAPGGGCGIRLDGTLTCFGAAPLPP